MSYHMKYRNFFLKKFCMMSKNKTENAIIKYLILLYPSKNLCGKRCENLNDIFLIRELDV
jgi:hypothetical protein